MLDGLDHDIVEIEAQVFSPERTNPAERIYKLKRQVLDLYRNVEPLIEPLEPPPGSGHVIGATDLGPYFRDVYDHLQREVARIEIQRELLSEVLDVNLTHISVQQNEDMRRISGWVAIAAVPTMLAGVWGMNFEHMPELDEPWGYPAGAGRSWARRRCSCSAGCGHGTGSDPPASRPSSSSWIAPLVATPLPCRGARLAGQLVKRPPASARITGMAATS